MEQELADSKQREQISSKRRAYSQRRKDLGFKNVPEELDDPVLDTFAVKDAKYQKSLQDQRERAPVKLAT
jgi:hypothetical protein